MSVDVADFSGLMSGKVKYCVGKLSVTPILLSMKLHVPLEDGTKIYLPACQPGTTIGN